VLGAAVTGLGDAPLTGSVEGRKSANRPSHRDDTWAAICSRSHRRRSAAGRLSAHSSAARDCTSGSASRTRKSKPAAFSSRVNVGTVGWRRPFSYADIRDCATPARSASSAWVRPALTRASRSRSPASELRSATPQYTQSRMTQRCPARPAPPFDPNRRRRGPSRPLHLAASAAGVNWTRKRSHRNPRIWPR
jgi:rhodanese-related sulfurtransferase